MNGDWNELLSEELKRVPAPAGLWNRVQARLDQPARKSSFWTVWPAWAAYVSTAALVLIAVLLLWDGRLLRRDRGIDLRSYLAPVQSASEDESGTAIAKAPAQFRTAVHSEGPSSVAGYQVTARREARIGGAEVKQVVLTAPHESVALFIAPPRVPLDTGRNYWVDSTLAGVSCKRLSNPHLRTVLFPCLQQSCVIVCKACSEAAILAVMRGVDQVPEILR